MGHVLWSVCVFFFVSLKVLICRNYRGDVDMSEIEHFMTLLMDKEEEGTLSPILAHGGVRFMWIKHNNLYRILPAFVRLLCSSSRGGWSAELASAFAQFLTFAKLI